MKQIQLLSVFILIFSSINVFSQIPVFEWASNQQYVSNFMERCITADSSGNVLITGYFSGYHDFDPGPADLLVQATGSSDPYIIKLDAAGNLLWFKTFPATANPSASNEAYCVVTDSAENIYVSGSFFIPLDFDPGPATYTLSPTSGVSVGFIFSLDPNGNFRWANNLPRYGNSNMDYRDLSYCADGSILLADRYSGTIDFDPGPNTFNLTAGSNSSAYVMKVDLDGNFMWAKSFDGGFQGNYGVTTHSSGNVFMTGYYGGTVDLDPGLGTLNVSSSGLTDCYVVKLDPLGDLIWGKSFGGTDWDKTAEIDVDEQENVYVSGIFKGTADFDPGPGVSSLTAVDGKDPFLLKLAPNGDFDWVHNFGGVANNPKITVCTDPYSNVYVTGRYRDTLDFQPGPGIYNQISGSSISLFIVKYEPSGSLSWLKSIDGTGYKNARSIYCDPLGNVYAAGTYDDSMDFNPGFNNAAYVSVGGDDGYTIKYSQCYQSNPVPDVITLSDVTSECSIGSIIAPVATENCTGTVIGVPDVTFPINSIGTTVITWTYDAGNGFVSTQMQNVIITDAQPPVPDIGNLSDVSYACSTSSLTAPTASDNCSNAATVTNDAVFPILANTTVTWTYDDNNGNTSTQTQNVVITPIDNGISISAGITLTANASGYSYQWVDCDNGNAPISGATNQFFEATSNGSYAVEISNINCSVISSCIEITEVGFPGNTLENSFVIYPNPTSDELFIELNKSYQNIQVNIKDASGRMLGHYKFQSQTIIELNLFGNSGLYFIEIKIDNQTPSVFRIIKE